MDTIDVYGVTFVKASKAAKDAGYTPDYVGQLCRGGKIESRLVGRTWYVRDGVLEEHRKEKSRQNKTKTIQDVEKALKERENPQEAIYKPIQTPSYKKHFLDASITYSSDTGTELMPTLLEQPVHTEQESEIQRYLGEQEDTEGAAHEANEEEVSYIPLKIDVDTAVEEDEKLEPVPLQSAIKIFLPIKTEVESPDFEHTEEGGRKDPVISSVLPAAVSVAALILLIVGVFLQNVWVYEADGDVATNAPHITTSFGIASLAVILEEILE